MFLQTPVMKPGWAQSYGFVLSPPPPKNAKTGVVMHLADYSVWLVGCPSSNEALLHPSNVLSQTTTIEAIPKAWKF